MSDPPVPDTGVGAVAFLGMGSNLGARSAHLAYGLRGLATINRLTGVSGVYESDPVGFTDQPMFLNMVARVETELGPRGLLEAALEIERRRGRVRSFPNAPRSLDIDVLIYDPSGGADRGGGAVIDERGLTIPHPRMTERAFVLVPLLELEPDLAEPGTGRPYAELLEELRASHGAGEAASEGLGVRRVMDGETLLLEEPDE